MFGNLIRKGVEVQNVCHVCNTHVETVIHVLKDCSFARFYWAVTFANTITTFDTYDVWNWFLLYAARQMLKDGNSLCVLFGPCGAIGLTCA